MMRRPFLLGGILLAVLGSLCPFLWFVLTSFKSQIQVEAIPPTWWPDGSLVFYVSALVQHRLLHYVTNSLIVAAATTVVALVVATPAAYALARLRLPGKTWVLGGLLCVAMFSAYRHCGTGLANPGTSRWAEYPLGTGPALRSSLTLPLGPCGF